MQVTPLSLLLSTKDKKTAVRLRPGGLLSRTEEEAEDDEFRPASSSGSRGRRSSASSSARTGGSGMLAGAAARATAESRGQHQRQQEQQGDEEPVLAEPVTFYRLADGSWHFEMCRFYTAAQAEAAAAAAGRTLVLPQGFDRSCELLKALEREHAPMTDIAGVWCLSCGRRMAVDVPWVDVGLACPGLRLLCMHVSACECTSLHMRMYVHAIAPHPLFLLHCAHHRRRHPDPAREAGRVHAAPAGRHRLPRLALLLLAPGAGHRRLAGGD